MTPVGLSRPAHRSIGSQHPMFNLRASWLAVRPGLSLGSLVVEPVFGARRPRLLPIDMSRARW